MLLITVAVVDITVAAFAGAVVDIVVSVVCVVCLGCICAVLCLMCMMCTVCGRIFIFVCASSSL